MSDILIRGMEMPITYPLKVTIYPDGQVLSETVGAKDKHGFAVHVSLHGDLIERDALTISTAVPLDGKSYQYVHIDNIKGASIIIPASEED